MIEILSLPFMQRALLAALVSGLIAPAIGIHIVNRRMSLLGDGLVCATLEIKFNYHVGVREGLLTCEATVLHQGKRIANIDARLYQDGRLVSSANGNFAIFPIPSAQ